MGDSNDIIINAKATTAAAEKSINALDAKIQALAANSQEYSNSRASSQAWGGKRLRRRRHS